MRGAGRAAGAVGQRARLGLGQRHQLLDRLSRHRRVDRQHVGHVRHVGQRRPALHRIVAVMRIDQRIDGQGADVAHQHGEAVGLGARHHLAAQRAAAARPVLDDAALAERDLQLGRDLARQDVGRAAGRERHDQMERPGGKRLGTRRRQRRETCRRAPGAELPTSELHGRSVPASRRARKAASCKVVSWPGGAMRTASSRVAVWRHSSAGRARPSEPIWSTPQ